MKNTILTLLFVTLILPAFNFADSNGSILGTIYDKDSGEPISGVRIELLKTNYSTTSASDGTYALTGIPAGEYKIYILKEGYGVATAFLKVKTDMQLKSDFHLEKADNVNEYIVITATKTNRLLQDIPVPTAVITKKDIEKANYQTVEQALRYLSGVRINETLSWGDRGKVEIMGLDAQHTLVLMDGQRVFGGHGDSVDIQSYPIDMIEKIEVVKGPASSLYGSDAMAGVVNIITKSDSNENPFNFNFSPSFGSQNRRIYRVNADGSLGKLDYVVGYTHNQTDGIDKELDHFSEDAVFGTVKYEASDDFTISLKPFYSRNEMIESNRIQERASFNLQSSWQPSPLSKLNFRASLFSFDNRWTEGNSETGYNDEIASAELFYNHFLFNSHSVTIGAGYEKLTLDNDNINLNADQSTSSVFAQDEIFYNPFSIVIGARLDIHDKWGTEFNPRASMLVDITDSFKLRASFGRAFRGPSLTKLYGNNWRMGPYVVLNNEDLQPETSVGYQIGGEWIVSSKLMFSLHWFLNEVENLINAKYSQTGMPPWNLTWENIDKVRTQGFEVNIAAQIGRNISFNIGYTYLDTEDRNTGFDLPLKPVDSVNMRFNWRIPSIDLDLVIDGRFIGERFWDEDNQEKLGSYTLLNLSIDKEITEFLKLFLRAENLLDNRDIKDSYYIDGIQYMAGLKFSL